MITNILKYIEKNKEKLLVFIGEISILLAIVYFVSKVFDYLVTKNALNIDPVLSIVIFYFGYKLLVAFRRQNSILEQQNKTLEKITKKPRSK